MVICWSVIGASNKSRPPAGGGILTTGWHSGDLRGTTFSSLGPWDPTVHPQVFYMFSCGTISPNNHTKSTFTTSITSILNTNPISFQHLWLTSPGWETAETTIRGRLAPGRNAGLPDGIRHQALVLYMNKSLHQLVGFLDVRWWCGEKQKKTWNGKNIWV